MRHLSLWSSPRNQFDFFKEFNEMLNGFDKESNWAKPMDWARPLDSEFFTPLIDIEETEKDYSFTVDIPGMKKEDIKIEVKDRQLIISGERLREKNVGTETNGKFERSFGRFFRSFTLPQNVEDDKVEAKYTDGVLEITVPKSQKSLSKTISIK